MFTTNIWADNHSLSVSDKLFKEATDLVKARKYEKAVKIFEELANSKEHDAQYNLAILLKAGKGKTKNYTEGLLPGKQRRFNLSQIILILQEVRVMLIGR